MNSARYGDVNSNFVNVLNTKEVIHIDNGQTDLYKGALTVEGGAVIKKGLKIGYQENTTVSGLMIYDNENFYGYSDKYGLILLSKHNDYIELEIDKSFFDKNDGNRITPIQTNSSKNMSNFNDIDNKYIPLKLDIDIKDLSKFYLTIPALYTNKNFILNIEFDLSINNECLISDIVIIIINQSNKPINYKFNNKNCYYNITGNAVINSLSTTRFQIDIVDKKYYLISTQNYSSQ
jgi:hypothetical protein